MADTQNYQTMSKLVMAIDFGTTFSGVAFQHTSRATEITEGDAKLVAQNVEVIRQYPNTSSQYSEKTATVIAYNRQPPTWGGNVKSEHRPRFENFKLLLEESVPEHYGIPGDRTPEALLREFEDHEQLRDRKPVDLAADYLTCLYKFVHETFLPGEKGAQFLRNQNMSYIITVPAIWSDGAKALTRQAATRAGIPGDKLLMIPEPEAAALYCATMADDVDLNAGDCFLVCDAGGGTVVLHSLLTASV
jgi:molecular chaperone DnaK (HSP70)